MNYGTRGFTGLLVQGRPFTESRYVSADRTLGAKADSFLKCHDMLNPWSLHVQESFDYIQCSDGELRRHLGH